MSNWTALAETLQTAYENGEPIDPDSLPAGLRIEDGYAIQDAIVDRRSRTGGPVVGYKIGFTNETVQSDLGVAEPVYGRILEATVGSDGRVERGELIDPLIEPEIVFVLDRALSPPVTRLDVAAATRFVVPAIEIVDSRIEDWAFGAAEAVADNALAARLHVGDPTPVGTSDLALEGVEVRIADDRRATGTGGAVLGHPADAVCWLAEALDARGDALDAGDIVTTGSITEPLPLESGETVVARFSSLGTVAVHAG
ncbi:2-keto-4-pentenoate hydratase [Natronomonas sp.]|uniref:2-keto-4-pentenoate hydratase n=1 Tax=Natronomonas sp. TaxID=2184060 RepID=UPI003974EC06